MAAAAERDASEMYRQYAATSRKIIAAPSRAAGESIRKTPAAVATPLPPLNFSHRGKQCPRNAATPASLIQQKREHSRQDSRRTRHICRADIAAAHAAQVARAKKLRQEQAERNGAEQVGARDKQQPLVRNRRAHARPSATKGNDIRRTYSAPECFSLLS